MDCTIVQVAPAGLGRNIATCVEVTSNPGVEGRCEIVQENVDGSNMARVLQTFAQSRPADPRPFSLFNQFGDQKSTIEQTNQRGKNRADVSQRIRQRIRLSADPDSPICCLQQAQQSSALEQTNVDGENRGSIDQDYDQDLNNRASFVGDFQGGANLSSNEQRAVTGRQVLELNETYSQEMKAPNALAGSQVQDAQPPLGPFGTIPLPDGTAGRIVQDSNGVSNAEVAQRGVQRVSAEPGVTQVQFDPFKCCLTQTGNPRNRARIDQKLSQFATGSADAPQTAMLEGNCTTSGNCFARQRLNQDGVITQRSGSGADVHISIAVSPPCSPPFCLGPPPPG